MNKKQQAFTLVELMVTVAILSIAATIAIPSFMSVVKRQQLQTVAQDYYAALNYARSEAIRSGKVIKAELLDVGSSWSGGFELIKVHDKNDSSKNEILRWIGGKEGVDIEESGNASSVQFDGKGYLSGDVKIFKFCNGRANEKSYQVSVLGSGIAIIKPIGGC